MSKSKRNFITLNELLKSYDGNTIRFFLSSYHYRKPINFTEENLLNSKKSLTYLLNTYFSETDEIKEVSKAELMIFLNNFKKEMNNDFNTSNALSVIYDFSKWINSGNYNSEVKTEFLKILNIFGIYPKEKEEKFPEEVLDLLNKRSKAKESKDYNLADNLRKEISKLGYKVIDKKESSFLEKK